MRRHALPKKTFEAAAAANAHLIVQIKDNQPTLYREVEAVCATAQPLSSERNVDKNRRNRHETHAVAVFEAKPAVAGTEWEPHVAAIIRVERTVLHFQPTTGRWKTKFRDLVLSVKSPSRLQNRRNRRSRALGHREHIPLLARCHLPRGRLENQKKSGHFRPIAQLRLQYPEVQSN